MKGKGEKKEAIRVRVRVRVSGRAAISSFSFSSPEAFACSLISLVTSAVCTLFDSKPVTLALLACARA